MLSRISVVLPKEFLKKLVNNQEILMMLSMIRFTDIITDIISNNITFKDLVKLNSAQKKHCIFYSAYNNSVYCIENDPTPPKS